tara:strand:- start:10508 stop:11641 length:1134 start_codon:yes stop_codon:yes gene_type:complete
MTERLLSEAQRIVVKIGSTLLVNQETGEINMSWLSSLAEDINKIRLSGTEVIIVTSGAIAAGRRFLCLDQSKLKLEESQAAAACGQIKLAHAYQSALQLHGITVAQILLTIGDMDNRRRYLNARNTISELLKLDALPVINENDTVATAEIRFGDNDRLAAGVATMMAADSLVLLSSDIDGLYTADPAIDSSAKWVPKIEKITTEIEKMAGVARSDDSSGGMVTKIIAAQAAMASGCSVAIANGKVSNPLARLLDNGRASWFVARSSPGNARKHWIMSVLQPRGKLIIDKGASEALISGKSLLPAGVLQVEGKFERGDAVSIIDDSGIDIGCGLVAYSAEDAAQIIGSKTAKIEKLLGYSGRDEMIHRDDLVLREEAL